MTESWWAVNTPDGYDEIHLLQEDAANSAKKYARFFGLGKVHILEVEIRPLHGDPCEWELRDAPAATQNGEPLPDSTNLQRIIGGGCHFCPSCGRSLEE